MAVLPIRTFGFPGLRERAREVGTPTSLHRKLIEDMLETMRAAPGVGLAGPQVGVMERIFVWETEDGYGAVVDPVITERSEETVSDEEGCLSLPGLYFDVERAQRVTITGLDADGDPLEIEVEGFKARIFQHEIDHLDGVLFIDRLSAEDRKVALMLLREQALGLRAPAPAPRGDERL